MVVRPVLLPQVGACGVLLKRVGVDYGAEIRTLQQKGAGICVVGDRLRAERERLGLTQPAFAEIAGSKKRTLIDWEKGVSSPTAVQLAALANVGVDVLYVVTGTVAPGKLDPEEQTMLGYFRAASPEVRRAALGALIGATPAGAGLPQSQGVNLTNHGHGAVQIGAVGGNVVQPRKRK
ncbi:helix-turn-helix transcriptional regulator [Acidovorax sp.]|uniref:helix-turn-helix domain-containing protein n=1 Tax=Acidovorax sp. TaxID=1872122 RepID=UPI002ACEE080|nr:helix-turn-helix transcriptional regulator [Acidovorax sp.]MDZ7862430.1 helix-turn-helix transcriptional regulator [Acidovorax sp.]